MLKDEAMLFNDFTEKQCGRVASTLDLLSQDLLSGMRLRSVIFFLPESEAKYERLHNSQKFGNSQKKMRKISQSVRFFSEQIRINRAGHILIIS